MDNLNLKPFISKKEKIFLVVLGIFLALTAALPDLYGFLNTPPDKVFTWATSRYPFDYNTYHVWVNQASQGKIMMEILYTSEPHPALFFHPVFYLIGQVNYFLKIPAELIFLILSFFANFFLLIVIYYFISHFISRVSQRIVSLVLISFSSGLSWLLGETSADGFLMELSLLNIMRWPLITSLGLILIILALISFIKSLEEQGFKKEILTGFLIFLLALIHPYDLVVFYGLALSYLIFFTKFWQKIFQTVIIFLFPLPVIVYNFLLNNSSLVWRQHSLAPMSSPHFFSYFLGLFPLFILLPFAWREIKKQKSLKIIFLWVITYFILVYLPLTFQWKLSLGIFVPLGILAGIGLSNIASFLNKRFNKNYLGYIFIFFVVLFSSINNFFVLVKTIEMLKTSVHPFYLSKEEMAAFTWLKNNLQTNDVVFSSYETGNFIPRYTGKRVFFGHWAQTIFVAKKSEIVKIFFSDKISDNERKEILKNNRINYVFYGEVEKKMGLINPAEIGQEVFKNSKVSIIKINL